jgi:hypothetical protein
LFLLPGAIRLRKKIINNVYNFAMEEGWCNHATF